MWLVDAYIVRDNHGCGEVVDAVDCVVGGCFVRQGSTGGMPLDHEVSSRPVIIEPEIGSGTQAPAATIASSSALQDRPMAMPLCRLEQALSGSSL